MDPRPANAVDMPSLLLTATLACLALVACSSSGGAGNGGRFVFETSEDDVRIGREGAATVERELGLLGDEALDDYVDGLGQRILRGLGTPRFDYTFRVVNEPQPNAFVLPGGFVFVTRGLLVLLNDEDELACLLGHEIIHAEQRHAARQQAFDDESPLLSTWRRAVRRAS